ncbi:hypothetical protein B5S32_g3963 [[Candida] boidinii]|nr:hypothetical protein B5S32_g3963 [[Candida] boidinii]
MSSIRHHSTSHPVLTANKKSVLYEINRTLLQKNLLPKSSNNSSNKSLRCIVFDSNGNITNIASDIKKTELISKHDLLPRDLRKIDKGYNDIVPSILIRDHSILLNVLNIKALIKADSVVLFNHPATSSHVHKIFIEELKNKLKLSTKNANNLPYEIRALETIFMSVIDNLNSEMKVHVTVVNGVLKELEDHIDSAKLRYLLLVSKKLSQFQQKTTLIRDLCDELLDQDDELAELYLTEKKFGTPRELHDHREVEMLLETYSLHCDAIVQTVENTIKDVKTTEEIINIILDSNRNQLMLLGLRFTAGLLSFASLLYIAAVFGMNLENFIEEKDHWFFITCTLTTLVAIYFFRLSIKKLNSLQRLTMVTKGKV